ncbi:MAG: hypothetical protein ACD_40C00008G0002 [uncultured bacterium]|nr:MAG: hypothetical protein ACD_40C00008G0002 [uncultured bacterium]KKU25974.1 MAG: hypothetical protein UX37_C0008G0027 [Microgenomates group bacterium GW2011_GWA2_46_16]
MNGRVKQGQVGLLLLVIMGVVVALAMSVASRSLSDTVLSRQEKESSAAFGVAETGVESALNLLRQGSLGGGDYSLTDSTGLVTGNYRGDLTTYTLFVKEGETAHLDLSSYVPTLNIAWTKKGANNEDLTCQPTEGSGNSAAAIEIIAIQASTNIVKRSYFNPSNCPFTPNNFWDSDDGGANFRSMINPSYSVPPNTTIVRIKPLYAGATISVTGSSNQMYLIQSKASGGDAQKEIQVKRGLDAPPSVFDFALFSGTIIVK